MSFYLNIPFLGDYCDIDVEYDIIDGDDSVGLPVDYEIISCTAQDEDGNEIEIWDQLYDSQQQEVIKAIEEDLESYDGY